MKRILLLAFVLLACGQGRISPQGGTVTGVTAGDGLTGGGTSGLLTINVVAGNGLDAAGDEIKLEPCATIGHTWVWDGAAFTCDTAGGTAFSTLNVIPKGDGAGMVASCWTDDGTTASCSGNVSASGYVATSNNIIVGGSDAINDNDGTLHLQYALGMPAAVVIGDGGTETSLTVSLGDTVLNGNATVHGNTDLGDADTDDTEVFGALVIKKTAADSVPTIYLNNDVQSWQIATRGDTSDALVFRDVTGGVDECTLSTAGVLNCVGGLQVNGTSVATTSNISGTSGRSTRFTGTNTVANGAFSDDGSNASVFGNLRAVNDDTYFAWDNGTNLRVGFTKKSAASPKLTYGSATTFAIAQSDAAGIEATNAFTDRFIIGTTGNVGIGPDSTPDFLLDVQGTLGVDGGATIGDNPVTDNHAINAQTVVHTSTGSGTTASSSAFGITRNGTYDTTAGAMTSGGANITSVSTRSAGANNLTNRALNLSASGAQVNLALQTQFGDNWFNVSGGSSTFYANTQLGDASTDRVGIGIAPDSNHAMTFAAVTGNKIALYPQSATAAYGLGVLSGARIAYYTSDSAGTHSFGYGDSDAFTEAHRLEADGDSIHGISASNTHTFNGDLSVVEGTTTAAAAPAGTVLTLTQADGTAGYISIRTSSAKGIWFGDASATSGGITYDGLAGDGLAFATGSGYRALITSVGAVAIGDTAVGTSISSNADVLLVGNTGTGQTASTSLIDATHTGSFNTTAGALTVDGISVVMTATESAGANVLTSRAAVFGASGADVNYAIQTTVGDSLFAGAQLLEQDGQVWFGDTAGTAADDNLTGLATITYDSTISTDSLTHVTLDVLSSANTGNGVSNYDSYAVRALNTTSLNLSDSGGIVNFYGVYADVDPDDGGGTEIEPSYNLYGVYARADGTSLNTTSHGVLPITAYGVYATATTLTGSPAYALWAQDGLVNLEGATTINDTLHVTGATTLDSTLYVDGTVQISGATTIDDTLNVTGATSLSTLSVAGSISDGDSDVTVSDGLNVTGNVTLGADELTTTIVKGVLDARADATFGEQVTFTHGPSGINNYDGTHLEWSTEWMWRTAANGSHLDIYYVTLGGGAFTQDAGSSGTRAGVMQAQTASSATATVLAMTNLNAYTFGTFAESVFEWVGGFPTLSTSSEEFYAIVGFHDVTSSVDQQDGCYFLYNRANSATSGPNAANADKWSAWCVSNSTRTAVILDGTTQGGITTCDASIGALSWATSTNVDHLKIVVTGAATAEFYVDGSLCTTLTTNIPDGTARLFGTGWRVTKTAGTNARHMDIDYTRLAFDLAVAR